MSFILRKIISIKNVHETCAQCKILCHESFCWTRKCTRLFYFLRLLKCNPCFFSFAVVPDRVVGKSHGYFFIIKKKNYQVSLCAVTNLIMMRSPGKFSPYCKEYNVRNN